MGISSETAVVVLGGRLRFAAAAGGGEREPPRLVGAVARRCALGAAVFREERAVLIVAAGGCAWDGTLESDAMAAELRALGVPAESIVRERLSVSTRENARYAARLLFKRGIERAIVVTCDWHLPRARRAFEKEGLVVSGQGAKSPELPPIRRAVRTLRERLAERYEEAFR